MMEVLRYQFDITISPNKTQWVLRCVPSLANKPVAQNDPNKKKEHFNPFLNPDPNLVVDTVYDKYNLMLNKFNVAPYHLLLTTKEFESQSDMLNKNDLKSL